MHPGNAGYALFADSAWDAFNKAVAEKAVCAVPQAMLHSSTYMSSARVRVSSLGILPVGWRVGSANLTAAYFDMLMSRWLDDEVIAANGPETSAKGEVVAHTPPGRLKVNFRGSMVMLFGEATPRSGKYRVWIDGKPLPRKNAEGKVVAQEFDGGEFAKRVNGNAHLVQVLAEGLDTKIEHTLEIEPAFDPGVTQELRIESICVAGEGAAVTVAK